jgi:hypothetical protein
MAKAIRPITSARVSATLEGRKAMREDGLKVETLRMLVEFTP